MTESDTGNNLDVLQKILGDFTELKQQNINIEVLLKVIAQPLLEDMLIRVFKNEKQLRAYELSDGKRSTREIGSLVGVDQKTISTWWRTWEEKFGIVEKVGKQGQFRKKFSFLDLMLIKSPPNFVSDE